ncbi:P-loop NTPase fold protein [Clostridium tunisiense]|uniref:P-loop NTPase fold protein n=1 Tax=Clostridium tunisiense TaxID=219748 RepID=UPI00037FBB0C|nr:P-loop NTPase fold protein [Clostridium tunisiense]
MILLNRGQIYDFSVVNVVIREIKNKNKKEKFEMEFLINKLKNEDISKKIYVIGIDGLGGAGKSTLVNSLKLQLQSENYYSYVLHIDDFIHPKRIRYDLSKEEWDCYYNVQWRYDYLVKEILSPIKNGEIIDKQIEIYDKENDRYTTQRVNLVNGSVLILEGIFLQRKELKPYLDFIIYLEVSRDVRLNRVLARDGYMGGLEDIKCKYEKRYFPAEEKYILEYSPIETADYLYFE